MHAIVLQLVLGERKQVAAPWARQHGKIDRDLNHRERLCVDRGDLVICHVPLARLRPDFETSRAGFEGTAPHSVANLKTCFKVFR